MSHLTVDALTASRLAAKLLSVLRLPKRPSGASEKGTNIEMAELLELLLADSSYVSLFLGQFVAASSSIPGFQRQQSSSTLPVMAPAAVFSLDTPIPFIASEPPAFVFASRSVGLPPILTSLSDPNSTGNSSAVTLSLETQTPCKVSTHLRLSPPLEAMAATGTSLSRQLATFKCQRGAARWDFVATTAEHRKVGDKNDKLRFFLTALRIAFQVSHPPLVGLALQVVSVPSQTPPTNNVNYEAS